MAPSFFSVYPPLAQWHWLEHVISFINSICSSGFKQMTPVILNGLSSTPILLNVLAVDGGLQPDLPQHFAYYLKIAYWER